MGLRIEEKKRIKKEALLSSAFELFTEKGINDTSISDIAKKAKMAKGTFYLYFKDKYDIRDRLIVYKANHLFEKAQLALLETDARGLEDKVFFIVDSLIDQLAQNKALLRFISKNLSWAMFTHIRISSLDNKNCMDIFEHLLQESGRKFRNKELMVFMIVELVNSSCHSVILYESPCTVDELKIELKETIRGIISQFEIKE